jgi:methyl-accepting chemotaxis protein
MLLMNHEIRNVVLAGQMDSLKAQSVIGSAMAELSPVIIIALLISAFLCMGISTYFSIAIKNVLLTIGELRKNHLSARTDNRSKDEIGQMSRELDGFADNLKINVLGVMQRIAAGNTSDLDLKCEDPYDEVIPVMISTVETLRDITGDTKSIIAAAEAGDLTQRCRAEIYRGSWADLAGEINNLMDSISRPVHEVCENINKISVFDFTSQVTGNYEGLFKEMAEDTNNLCMRLRGIQHALDMVSNGDTSIRGNYEKIGKRSDNDQMMPTIIRMFENIENMICETKNLSENSVNGNIDIRGDISKFSGGYKEVIEGFNNTLDAVAAPITEMHEVLDAMAVNDYTLSVSEGYKGEYDKLANAINDVRSRLLTVQNVAIKISEGDTSELEVLKPIGRRSENDRILPALIKMMENINLLIKETTAIADSAAEGNLDIRGDADQFGGGYRHIVQSINAFLDAVEAPVGEITDVMGSVETGVLDCRITSDYQGKFKELADAVNHTVMQLMSIIQEMNHALTEISKGNLSMSAVREYEGDYHPLSVATNLILDSLNDLLSKIDIDSQQVREGASELSEASQNLAQGATEQASSVEELSASIAEIASETISQEPCLQDQGTGRHRRRSHEQSTVLHERYPGLLNEHFHDH